MKRFTYFFLILIVLLICLAVFCLEDLNMTKRTIYVTTSPSTVYTCPVKKHSVTLTFHRSEGPGAVQVKLLTQDPSTDEWIEASDPVVIELGQKHTFDLPQAAKYEIQAEKTDDPYFDGNCTFLISAAP